MPQNISRMVTFLAGQHLERERVKLICGTCTTVSTQAPRYCVSVSLLRLLRHVATESIVLMFHTVLYYIYYYNMYNCDTFV